MPRLKSPKQKGDRFERELAEHLNQQLGLDARRMPLSGGGVGIAHATGDLTGTPLVSVEAKAVQALNFRAALAQATRSAGADMPVVINRRNRESMDDAVVAMRLKDWLVFYDALLLHMGYRTTRPAPTDTLAP